MAIAKITLTCTECGNTFEHRKECRNRSEADSHEAWAKENIDLCPACYRARQQRNAQAAVMAALEKHGINLPELAGVSEKQIAYAKSVRDGILAMKLSELDAYVAFEGKVAEAVANPDFARCCADNGQSVAEAIEQTRRDYGMEALHVAITATTAREILDYKY